MPEKNNLKTILQQAGFQSFSPTDKLLGELGFSRPGFFKFFNNTSKKPLTASQKENLDKWTAKLGLSELKLSKVKAKENGGA